jgi:dihydroxy-acid dehydratase
VIWSYDKPLVKDAGFLVLRGNLFDSAIMKTSVISKEFRDRYLVNPKDPNAFEGRAIVFEGPEDYHERIDDPSLNIDEHCILFIRGAGPIGYPGGAEVVNMQPPAALIKRGILSLPCIGDGRQSGTSGSPSIHKRRVEEASRRAEGPRRLPLPAQPDAVAGTLSLDRRPAGHRRLHGARHALSKYCRHGRRGAG